MSNKPKINRNEIQGTLFGTTGAEYWSYHDGVWTTDDLEDTRVLSPKDFQAYWEKIHND